MLVTFAAMLAAVPVYSALVNRLPRRWLVRIVFHFFCVSLFAFSAALHFGNDPVRIWTARVFFVWVNVFGLFITSVFWSVLADLFTSDQGKQLFGRIAAGGTVGAISGSLLTSQIATLVSMPGLLLIPIVSLQLGLWCAWRLERGVIKSTSAALPVNSESHTNSEDDSPLIGGLLQGITQVFQSPYLASICVFLVFAQSAGTLLYYQQASVVKQSIPDPQKVTQFFAYVDFSTQVFTLIAQCFLSSWLLRRCGVAITLMTLPMIYLIFFGSLAYDQSLILIAVAMVCTRGTAYGITVPAREVLFTVVSREDKYKSKSFIDTVVLRGGDAAASQLFGLFRNVAGFAFSTINGFALPLIGIWAYAAYRLGQRQAKLAMSDPTATAKLERSDETPV